MSRLLPAVAVTLLLLSSGVAAQLDYRPTAPPATFAAERSWYRDGDPIPFAGDLYYPSGPTVYFNDHSMVPTGEYDGVVLYADTTIEPYSVILVPVSDRLLRPYRPERTDQDLSTGRLVWSPSNPPAASGQAYPGFGPPREPQRWRSPRSADQEPLRPFEEAESTFKLATVRKPDGNFGIWLSFQGHRWRQTGEAVPFDAERLVSVGQYHGFTVYADSHEPYVVYVPSRDELVAPFRRIQE